MHGQKKEKRNKWVTEVPACISFFFVQSEGPSFLRPPLVTVDLCCPRPPPPMSHSRNERERNVCTTTHKNALNQDHAQGHYYFEKQKKKSTNPRRDIATFSSDCSFLSIRISFASLSHFSLTFHLLLPLSSFYSISLGHQNYACLKAHS